MHAFGALEKLAAIVGWAHDDGRAVLVTLPQSGDTRTPPERWAALARADIATTHTFERRSAWLVTGVFDERAILVQHERPGELGAELEYRYRWLACIDREDDVRDSPSAVASAEEARTLGPCEHQGGEWLLLQPGSIGEFELDNTLEPGHYNVEIEQFAVGGRAGPPRTSAP